MPSLNLKKAFAYDWQAWDQTEAVVYERPRRNPPPANPTLLPPFLVTTAKRRAITIRERLASGGAYVGSDVNWHLPSVLLPSGWEVQPADVLTDPDKERWTVLDVAHNKLKQTWRATCRNLSLAYNLADRINIERATISYDLAGAAVKTFPSDSQEGGTTLYAGLKVRMQPDQKQIVDERAIRGMTTRYNVIVEKEVEVITNEDRIYWPATQQYLEIIGYRQSEQIGELPIIEAHLVP